MTTATTLPPSTLDCIAKELSDHTPAACLLYIRVYAAAVHDRPALSQSELRDRLRLSGSTVHSQLRALEAAGWECPAVALAKAEERVVTPDRSYDWPSDEPKLQLLQRVRDEAHRFAVQYHETVRDDVSTALDEIEGVGPETRKRLLGRFGSVDGVRKASVDELCEIRGIGEQTATRIDRRLS